MIPTSSIKAPAAWFSKTNQNIANQVARRVVGQLLQTLLYENVIAFSEQAVGQDTLFIMPGKTSQNEPVEYRCLGYKSRSFDLIRLHFDALERLDQSRYKTPFTVHDVVDELLFDVEKNGQFAQFINEIEQTFIKDLQARSQGYQIDIPSIELSAEALEQHFMDAHSYHPCYKSRIGFSLRDNAHYGPEFGQSISLACLAVAKTCSTFSVSQDVQKDTFWLQQVGEDVLARWHHQLFAMGKNPHDYWFLPVHPWQWENHIVAHFSSELMAQDIVFLGMLDDQYQAQQSIRTLQNITDIAKPYVKLSLNMTNTSSARILAKHTVLNGPIITDWLHHLIQTNATAKRLDFVILREIAGASFVQDELPESRKPQTYGSLGAIWRESIHTYLREGESAVPFNGLSYIDNQYGSAENVPFIQPWVERYGLEKWVRRLLDVTVPPIVHMLYAEGVGMESHGQNIVLITKSGWPQRIALKDFHDGVRYSPAHLARPELAPTLADMPESHKKLNRNSFIVTDDVDAVRDFSCDCFFFICLSDLAIFLQQHFHLSEALFWEHVAEIIFTYQQQNPEYALRYQTFDLFAPFYEVEELTKRRLLGDGERRFKKVPNPLHPFGKV